MKQLFFTVCIITPLLLQAQPNPAGIEKGYPQGYFRNPLDIPILLAGNFGECRPGHYHSGMDIKTLGEEGQLVHAAAGGYISRVKMEKGGFGHAIYITHPNGYTTLYAHLSTFVPKLQEYVTNQQYTQQQWDVDLSFSPSEFPVAKGQQIAWSGNTGSSTAPHLHFELRDGKNEHPLNPELFGFPIIDKTTPVPAEVAIYAGNIYEDSVIMVPLTKKGDTYKPNPINLNDFRNFKDTVEVWAGLTGIGINCDDFMDGSDNTLAPYTMKLYMDGNLQCQITLDDIGYEETRYINGYADYKNHSLTHKWVQLLFKQPGNHLDKIYTNLNHERGLLDLSDKKVHKISVQVTDDKENNSTVVFYVKPTRAYIPAPLQQGAIRFKASEPNNYSGPDVAFALDNRQLYNDINFVFDKKTSNDALTDHFMLHHAYVPLHHFFELKLKPNKPVSFELRNKVALRYFDGTDYEGKYANFTEQGWYSAKVRNFGEYWLAVDTIPPVIKPVQTTTNYTKAPDLQLEVKDSLTGIKNFNGYLDGKWVCFEQHGDLFFYKFDKHCPKGSHELVFEAEDENRNKQTLKLKFTR